MRKFINSLFSRKPDGTGAKAPGAVPSPNPSAAEADSEIFLGRQPILNNEQKIFAYELLFRSSARGSVAGVVDDVQATSRLVINTFNNFGAEQVLGNKKAFINVSAELLTSEVLTLLPPERVVIELLEHVEPTAEVVSRCQALRDMGYQLALDDFQYRPEMEPLIDVASYIKFDVRALQPAELDAQLRLLRGRSLRLLAEKVETREEFNALRGKLFNYYQGYYFARPETLSMKRIDPSTQQVMQLFNLVIGNADQKLIENGFRQDVALSYNLLRYINSVGFGLLHKVDSIRHALVMLGNSKLARWLSLLLLSSTSGKNPAPQVLFRLALVRARMTEMLGRRQLGPGHQDALFMTGMFSLLDAMLDTPLEQSLASLQLPQPVNDALLSGTGQYAAYLDLCRACEQADLERIDALAPALGLSLEEISGLHLQAQAWAEKVALAG